ncbi:unnamed protein product [marine sediment metagenome]|uniref:Uncharacterized protein n=1 Tax=marine sediment metagenome TaxID=412755 RepID=X1A354_9ZZZZ
MPRDILKDPDYYRTLNNKNPYYKRGAKMNPSALEGNSKQRKWGERGKKRSD